jgi:fructuronate reductase
MAYLGLLSGITHVHEVIARPALRRYVDRLLREDAAPTLAGVSTDAYRGALLERFANGAVAHRTAQIAQDGSLKLPVRLVATAAERRAAGVDAPHVVLALAAWLRCVEEAYLTRTRPEIADPKAPVWRALAQSSVDAATFAEGVLTEWGALGDAELRRAVLALAAELRRDGAEAVVAKRYG